MPKKVAAGMKKVKKEGPRGLTTPSPTPTPAKALR